MATSLSAKVIMGKGDKRENNSVSGGRVSLPHSWDSISSSRAKLAVKCQPRLLFMFRPVTGRILEVLRFLKKCYCN